MPAFNSETLLKFTHFLLSYNHQKNIWDKPIQTKFSYETVLHGKSSISIFWQFFASIKTFAFFFGRKVGTLGYTFMKFVNLMF